MAQLADETHYARSTISTATSGEKIPTWAVVEAIVKACDPHADPALWGARWKAARDGIDPRTVEVSSARLRRRPLRATRAEVPKFGMLHHDRGNPTEARTLQELAGQLDGLRRNAGLSWRQLAARTMPDPSDDSSSATGLPPLSASTLHEAIVVRKAPTLPMILRVVQLCDGTAQEMVAWADTWWRLAAEEAGTVGVRIDSRHTIDPRNLNRIAAALRLEDDFDRLRKDDLDRVLDLRVRSSVRRRRTLLFAVVASFVFVAMSTFMVALGGRRADVEQTAPPPIPTEVGVVVVVAVMAVLALAGTMLAFRFAEMRRPSREAQLGLPRDPSGLAPLWRSIQRVRQARSRPQPSSENRTSRK